MTNKKERVARARRIRQHVKVPFVLSQKLARVITVFDAAEILMKAGYTIDYVVTGHCPDDGGENGFLVVAKDGKEVGRIPYGCTGLDV